MNPADLPGPGGAGRNAPGRQMRPCRTPQLHLSDADVALLRHGAFAAAGMRWHATLTGEPGTGATVQLRRADTGAEVYRARLAPAPGDGWRVAALLVEHDPVARPPHLGTEPAGFVDALVATLWAARHRDPPPRPR